MIMMGEKASVLFLNLAAFVEQADEALLPAVYAEISSDFGVGLSALEWLTFLRALVQALAAPLAAYFALRHSRVHIIGAGAVFWAIATASVGISTSYWQAALARVVNGVSLAIVAPAIMSLTADASRNEARGLAFGWVRGTGQIGAILVRVFAHFMGPQQVMGVAGWRATFISVALLTIMIGLTIFSFSRDLRTNHEYGKIGVNDTPSAAESEGAATNVEEFIQGTKLVLNVKTFQALVVQGVLGRLPWNALLLLTPWMQQFGLSSSVTSHVASLVVIGSACGSVFGGWIGDKAAERSPNKGRITCSQFSAGMGIPLSATLLYALPMDTESVLAYGSVMFSLGFFLSWILPAASWPIFAEVVPEELRTTVFSIDLAIERFFSAFSAPLVGFISRKHFGVTTSSNSSTLGKAIFSCTVIPCVLTILTMFLLYFTYPKDREQAKNVKALADEIRALEMGEHWENGEDNVWPWEDPIEDDEEELDLSLLLERQRLRDQGIT